MEKAILADRYIVQERFPQWGGRQGQSRLSASTAVVAGLGALGGTCANLLARAGVGKLRLIDMDHPSIENLHRQVLYTESDAVDGVTKAEAAAGYLKSVNSDVCLDPVVAKLDAGNASTLLQGADVVLDCLDNMGSRYILNEVCHKLKIPWVHAGIVGSRGQLMVIRPGHGPCLRCWCVPGLSERPEVNVSVLGVIGPTPLCVASLQADEALKLLLGVEKSLLGGLLKIELWPPSFKILQPDHLKNPHCPVCNGRYEYISL